MIARLRAALTGLARRAGAVVPEVPWRETAARTAIGMPARHPEHLTRSLRRRDERWLRALAGELWPADEYVAIVRDTRPGGPGGNR
jgi:hypothetical protein